MKQENMEILMDKWINEPEFRENLRRNPQNAVERAGVELSEEDLEILSGIDWNLSDAELQTRISKGS